MIACQITGVEFIPAILTLVFIPRVDILARKLDVPSAETHEARQPDDSWHAHGNPRGVHFPVGLLQNLDLLQKDEFERTFPIDDVQGFERSVEHKDMFEDQDSRVGRSW